MNINLGGSGLQLQELHFTQMPVQTSIDGGVVIKDAQISYLLPVTDDAVACCAAPEAAAWDKFVATYQRRGVARLPLQTQLLNAGGETAVRFSGQYVLQRGA